MHSGRVPAFGCAEAAAAMNEETVVTPAHRAHLARQHQERQILGRALAAWRKAARLTQVELAQRLNYSRSTVASAETGYSLPSRSFWRAANTVVCADGLLLAAFDRMDMLGCQCLPTAARLG